MRIENNRLILETCECSSCHGTRRVNDWVNCEVCKGKGKGPNGRRCPACGKNFDNRLIRGKKLAIAVKDCTACTDGTRRENTCDSLPDEVFPSLEFRVYRSNRHQTFSEALLGEGVYSCTDYGRHESMSDEELIAEVRKHTYVQATKVVDKQLNFCNHVGIFTNRNGFSVIPVFGQPEPIQNDLEKQLSESAGLAIGTKLAGEGLNGTLLAAQYRAK